MSPPRLAVRAALLCLLLAATGSAGAATAVEEPDTPTTLTLAGTDPAFAGSRTAVTGRLLDADGVAVSGKRVLLERRAADGWERLAEPTTDAQGRVSAPVTVDRQPRRNRVRASFAGDGTHAGAQAGPVTLDLRRRRGVLRVAGPDSVVDENTIALRVSWRSGNGEAVPGPVRVHRRSSGSPWRLARRTTTGDDGGATVRVTPRRDSRWRVTADALAWVGGGTSGAHAVDNRPSGLPVRLPRGAPSPRVRLPAQPSAVGEGANAVVTGVPDRVWRAMTGRTWHRGCPVGRSSLRYVRVNYWHYSGYRRRGELVVNADAAARAAAAFSEMYAKRLPLRGMYRVDRFGWSHRVRGGDDHRSMAAGNTSAFNCRDVVNRPGIRSPHSWGRAIDINTWENPYRSATGLVPNAWWQPRSHPRVAWRSARHRVVRVMVRHGFRWTYGTRDSQHFDARTGSARRTPTPDCGPVVCD